MRKTRPQPALASLSPAEKEKLAQWVKTETYAVVLDRIAKPRPEGFDLHISIRPLQVLRDRAEKLDRINAHFKNHRKLSLADLEKIEGGDLADFTEEIHHAILEAAADLAFDGDNNPAQLVALQRLADLPARCELREHKVSLDLRKEAHRLKIDSHYQRISTERLDLARRALLLREKLAAKPQANSSAPYDQNEVENAMHTDPILRHIGLPPEDDPSNAAPPSMPNEKCAMFNVQ